VNLRLTPYSFKLSVILRTRTNIYMHVSVHLKSSLSDIYIYFIYVPTYIVRTLRHI
jgi:hypothetical protein